MELQNEYIIVIYRDVYALEIILAGFSITNTHSWEEYLIYLNMNKKHLFPFSWMLGGKLFKIFSTFEEYEKKFEIVTISETYKDILKSLLGNEFGFFPYLED